VARVLDVGSLEDGSPFMVMEYLDGQDLDNVLRHNGPLQIQEAIGYLLQACEAIAEAHHLGIVHRDIKPSNFFLTTRLDGSPLIKVLDFGIAKARAEMEQDVSLTKTRTVLGSPVYMSPEQIRSARSVDHRSDIWSLGVTLYELLTDQLPFDGDSITGVAAAVSTDPIAPIRSVRPEIPIGLSLVVERCLEKKPADRYQTVAALAEDLIPYGPETARYSLTRIRGSLGMKSSESGKNHRASFADTGSTLATASTLMSTTGSTARTALAPKQKRRAMIYGGVALLLLIAILALATSKRAPAAAAPSTAPSLLPAPPAASAPIAPSAVAAAGLALGASAEAPVLPAQSAEVRPQVNAEVSSVNLETPMSAKPAPKKAVVSPPVRPAVTKSLTSSRPATKGSSTPKREEDIFETRK